MHRVPKLNIIKVTGGETVDATEVAKPHTFVLRTDRTYDAVNEVFQTRQPPVNVMPKPAANEPQSRKEDAPCSSTDDRSHTADVPPPSKATVKTLVPIIVGLTERLAAAEQLCKTLGERVAVLEGKSN